MQLVTSMWTRPRSAFVGAAGTVPVLACRPAYLSPLAWLGLWLVRQQPMAYAGNVHLDLRMLGAALLIAVFSALLAGVWPAWRASGVVPALQVKSL